MTKHPAADREAVKALRDESRGALALALEKGADPNGLMGELPFLHRACETGDPVLAAILLERGARANRRCRRGRTALHLAAVRNSFVLANVLLEHGASPNLLDQRGDSALHLAVRSGSVHTVGVLLGRGANPNVRSALDGRTPLHDAARGGDPKIVQALLRAGSTPDVTDSVGATPVMYASPAVVDLLLGHKARMKRKRQDGRPLRLK